MNKFTDDDLKQMKEWDRKAKKKGEFPPDLIMKFGSFSALLARLEAAEKVCIGIETICDAHDLHGQAEIDIKAWRKAAGK